MTAAGSNALPTPNSVAEVLGPWIESEWSSGLTARCRAAWDKQFRELSRSELATFLRQQIAIEQLVPVAREKAESEADDGSEIDDGELIAAIEFASRFTSIGPTPPATEQRDCAPDVPQ